MKRFKTKYPGIFFRKAERIGVKGLEKIYYIVFKKNGKVIEEKAGRQYADDMTPSKAAHIRSERIENKRLSRKEIKEQKNAETLAEQNKWTIERLWNEYKLNKLNLKGLKTDENRFCNYIKPHFGNKEPKEIISLDVDRLRIKLLKKRSAGTVKNVLELLRRIVNFGSKKNICEGISFVIEMPKLNNQKTEDLRSDQLSALLKAINGDSNIQAANLMKMALYTGMRRGELFKLKWSHIDFDRGFIKIRNPKSGSDQKIPLNSDTKKILQTHPKTVSKFVFPGRDGNQRTDIRRQVNRIKEKAGLAKDFRALHGLRHVYASMLASSGNVDMYTLQKLLTHKSPLMTQRYAHLRDETLKKASDLAGNLIDEAVKNAPIEKVLNIKQYKQ